LAQTTRGFLPDAEGQALFRAAMEGATVGPLLEIGSWCGRSAIYLGTAAELNHTVAFCVDHHRGSEELQAGWPHHDASVVDPCTGRIDTLPFLRRTLEAAGLEDTVVMVVGHSTVVARHWTRRLGLIFIDGGHGSAEAHADFEAWADHLSPGGLLIIHDVFVDPAEGGRPPFEIYGRAVESSSFVELEHYRCGSLRVLRRRS